MTSAVVSMSSEGRFSLVHTALSDADFATDVRNGLSSSPKTLPPRWFYDQLGSSLFDTICFLPEYYVTRCEAEVLTSHRAEIADSFGDDVTLIELGSGSARKTRILLDVLTRRQRDLHYVPVDVDAAMLERAGHDLVAEYPRLRVTAVCSDFTRPSIPMRMVPGRRGRTVVLFLGSTIGNLDPDAARAMLLDLRGALSFGDALFLGVDLRKSRAVLEPAYDDALGVTAAFNLNMLGRINRDLGGHFELEAFRHRAFYDETLGRIEMHLVSTKAQKVRVDALDLDFTFDEGETIHTESSYKHDDNTVATLAHATGFRVDRKWTDARAWFADVLLVAE